MTVSSLLSGLLGQSVVVAIVNTGIPSTLLGVRMLVVVKCTMARLRAVEEGSVFVEVAVVHGGVGIGFALAGGISGGTHAGGNNVLSETGGVDAHVLDVGQN